MILDQTQSALVTHSGPITAARSSWPGFGWPTVLGENDSSHRSLAQRKSRINKEARIKDNEKVAYCWQIARMIRIEESPEWNWLASSLWQRQFFFSKRALHPEVFEPRSSRQLWGARIVAHNLWALTLEKSKSDEEGSIATVRSAAH